MNKNAAQTKKLHPRNKHQGMYDFEKLIQVVPELENFVIKNPKGENTIDFSSADAVYLLNKALLFSEYNLNYWEVPKGYLCPPIPSRADYVHHVADLISEDFGEQAKGSDICVLDIGVGANLIYPIIGVMAYDWTFVGTDTEMDSLRNAMEIVKQNAYLKTNVALRYQPNKQQIFKDIIERKDYFDAVICNPPFFKSEVEALGQNARKVKNLGLKGAKVQQNFGGQNNELWCEGGELKFITAMMYESSKIRNQVNWFTALVSNKEHLLNLQNTLKKIGTKRMRVIPMEQGNKQSRFIAWSFK